MKEIKITDKQARNIRIAMNVVFFSYLAFALWFTLVFNRPQSEVRNYNLEVFWSYRKFFSGSSKDLTMVIQNIGNVFFFVPFGLFFPVLDRKKSSIVIIIVLGFAFSLGIELLQYFLRVGLFETDDIICNTLGTVLGVFIISKVLGVENGKI